MQQTPKYSFKVFWSDADNAFIATCPEFVGLSAFGDTEEEALREAKTALQMFIEDIQESGEPLPVPQTAHSYSGKLHLRIERSLHRQAAEMAEGESVSLNRYIEDALRAKVTGERTGAQMLEAVRREFAQNKVALASIAMTPRPPVQYVETVKTERTSTVTNFLTVTLEEDKRGN